MGPGPNYFSGRYEDVWVDENGYLHMHISEHDGRWYSSEVVSRDTMGWNLYLGGAGDLLEYSENIVLGLFTWDNNTFQTDGKRDRY